ncbi:MAG TPA: hypothetical protein VJN95_07875 [Gemmatimonadales bacterium]|nr:hypothetical protein [Gemmatimonadales bacterium]
MSILNQLASAQGRRDQVPNRRLAERLARSRDRKGIAEVARNLQNRDRRIQGDCVLVLEEIGAVQPRLIAPFTDDLLGLLSSRNNRLVWGAMAALSTVAADSSRRLFARRALLLHVTASGSVITRDKGIKLLGVVASRAPRYRKALLPWLLAHLQTCRSQEVPQHAESIAIAVNAGNRAAFLAVLEGRLDGMRPSRAARVRRVIRRVDG